MGPHLEDSPALRDLKIRQWNLRRYLDGDLSREMFERASVKLKELWADWDIYNQRRQP